MAAPSYVGGAAPATDAGGTWSFTSGAITAGDVVILQILQDGATAGAVALTSVTGFEDLAGTDNALTALPGNPYPVGSGTEAYQHLFIGRRLASGVPTAAGTNSTSEDLYGNFYAFTNVSTGTTLATVIENGTAGATANGVATDATALDTAVTTLGPDRLALNLIAVNDDNVIPAFTSETGGDWALAVAPYAESSGTDGAIALQTAYTYTSEVQEDTSGSGVNLGAITNNTYTAQSFKVAADMTTAYIDVALGANVGSPTDDLIFELRPDDAGIPSDTILDTETVAAATLTASAWRVGIPLVASLTANTTYWITAHRSGAVDSGNVRRWDNASSNVYANGTVKNDTTGTGTWSVGGTTFDVAFRVWGTPIIAGTINGGSASITDSDAWGVVGFALIGTTVADITYYPRHPAHDFGSVTNF